MRRLSLGRRVRQTCFTEQAFTNRSYRLLGAHNMSSITTHSSLKSISTESQSTSCSTSWRRFNYTADAPQAIGPYSQAIVSPPFVFVSGCLGFDAKTSTVAANGLEGQVHQALQNLKGIVEASGSQVGKIVKTTVRICMLWSACSDRSCPRETFDLIVLYRSS
jgi:hypothetical protein